MPHAMHACVMSRTPQASPPQKMARRALGELVVAEDNPVAEDNLVSFAQDYNRLGKEEQLDFRYKGCIPTEI